MSVSKPSRKKIWVLLAAVVAVVIVGVAAIVVLMNQPVSVPAPPSGPNVTIWNASFGRCSDGGNCGYSPTMKTATAGTNLTWTNTGVTHTVTTCDSSHYNSAGCPTQNAPGLDSFDSGSMGGSKTFVHTFVAAGTYNYYCTLHPWMQGKVIVQ